MIHIRKGAHLDDKQKRVIYNINPFTIAMNIEVTRGHSTPMEQLNIIEQYAIEQNCLFSEYQPEALHDKLDMWIDGALRSVYRWQQTWSMLLHKGVIINPPLAAECLFSYINSAGVDRKDLPF